MRGRASAVKFATGSTALRLSAYRVDRKSLAHSQNDAIDPNLTSRSPPAHGLFNLRVPKDLAEMQRQICTHRQGPGNQHQAGRIRAST